MPSNTITSNSQSLWQYLQALNLKSSATGQSATPAGGANASSPLTAADGTQGPTALQPTATQSALPAKGHQHHRHGQGNGLFSQLQAAVTTALQQANSAGTSADPNQIIENAMATVLRSNSGSIRTATANGTNATASPVGTTVAGPVNATTSNGSQIQAFSRLLQDNGVNAQQFRADFLAAIQDARNGQVNTATALQSLPPGSTVNTTG